MTSPIRLLAGFAVLASVLAPASAYAADGPDLSLSLTHAPDPVAAGDDLDMTFTVTNHGPGAATGVTVDYHVSGARWWAKKSGDIGTGSAGEAYRATISGALPEGESRQFVITLRAGNDASVTVDATLAAIEADPAAANNTAERTATVVPAPRGVWKTENPPNKPLSTWGAGYAYHPTMGYERNGRARTFGGVFVDGETLSLTRGYRSWYERDWSAWGGYTADPAARALPAMAYNPADNTIVMFGGLGQDGPLGDTWVQTEDEGWSRRWPSAAPSPRAGAGLAYAGGKLVLFGGEDDAGSLGDTWTWNGSTWAKLSTPVAPPARSGMTFTSDTLRGVAVLFGGCCSAAGDAFGDTWTFDGAAWAKQTPAAQPPARDLAAAAFDLNASSVALFGGVGNDGEVLGDLWTWDGRTWKPVAATGAVPVAREGAALFFARNTRSAPGRLLLYGGSDENGALLSDTSTIVLSGPSAVATPDALNFGGVPVNIASAPKTVQIRNTGIEPLTVTGASITGANAPDFSADTGGCPAPVAPGDVCSVVVRAAPKAAGNRSATLTVATDRDTAPVVSLKAAGAVATLKTPGLVSSTSSRFEFPVSWSSNTPGVVFDVEWSERWRNSSGAYVIGAWRRWKTGVGAGSAWFGSPGNFTSVPGHTYLFRVRARNGDAAGAWTPMGSGIVPVDDRSNWLGWSTGWTSQSVAGRYNGTLRVGATTKQWMTLTTDTNMFFVVGDRCPSCGAFRVYVNGALVATVDSYASTTKAQQLLYSRYLGSTIKRHSLKIVPVGTARRPSVKIDSIGLAR